MNDAMRERLRWRADWLAFRVLLQDMWADRIKYAADPNAEVEQIAKQSLNGFEIRFDHRIEGEDGHLIMQMALHEMESFWRALENRFPPGTPSAPLMFPPDDEELGG